MNLNKLFRQFKIQRKLTIAFTTLATIPMLLIGFFGIKYTIELLEQKTLQNLESSVTTLQIKVEHFLSDAQKDIFYLRQSYSFRQFLRGLSIPNRPDRQAHRQAVEQQFRHFAESRGIYYQIRFLDRQAHEMMRIEFENGVATIVPQDQLSRRQDIFYLYQIQKNRTTPLHYIPVELRGESDREHVVPAISYFVPVYSDSGGAELIGVLIANVFARELFQILREDMGGPERKTILADNHGYYLFDSSRSEWNKLLAFRKEGNVGHDFPKSVSDSLLSGRRGLIDERWHEIIAYAPIFFAGSPDNFIVLMQCVAKGLVRRPILSFMQLVAVFGALTFAIALLLGFLAANHFTKPIKALSRSSEMLARGNLNSPIVIETNDEIEQLAKDFNRMAAVIANHEKELQHHADELETKVQDRTTELSNTLSYLQNLIDSSIDAIITLDDQRKITFFSKGAQSILGYLPQEVIGRRICDFCSSCLSADCPIMGVSQERSYPQHHEIEFVRKDGETAPFSMSASAIKDDSGVVTGILTISKDMSEQRVMQRQVQQAEKLAGIGRLAAGLAHQLNTPLASIILSAQMAQETIQDQDPLDDVHDIEHQANHCKELIQDLLRFSRSSPEEKTRIDLHAAIAAALRLLDKELSNAHIEVASTLDAAEHSIHGNANQVEQLFFNLFNNARDAMPAGGRLRIQTSVRPRRLVEVIVRDSGVGIVKKNLSKIFEPFFTTKDVGRGTGLGLAICYGIVEDHGGSITVESQPGKGTKFAIRFPLSSKDS